MTTALVTGITGQDGSYLAERLAAEGHEVHGWARPGDTRLDALRRLVPSARIHVGDLADPDAVGAVVREVRPDEVYHLAAASSVAASWADPVGTQRTNAVVTGVLLDAVWRAADAGGPNTRFLHASSAEVFGLATQVPQDESTPLAPTSPYGATKAYGQLLVDAYRGRGLHASNAILFTHESPRRPRAFVTSKIVHAAADIAAGRRDHVELGNLDARRDWGWAPDHVAAMVAAVRHDRPGNYVVATGESHSVEQFVAAAFDRVGLSWRDHVRRDPGLLRPGDAAEQRGDSSHARRTLGWAPTVGFLDLVGRLVDAAVAEGAAGPGPD